MRPIDVVKLAPLMGVTQGHPSIGVALIDGPVAIDHPDLVSSNIRHIPGRLPTSCQRDGSAACAHATFVAGILVASRSSAAPAICPACTLFVRSIFAETDVTRRHLPSASPEEVAVALIDCVEAGARVINLSVALAPKGSTRTGELEHVLDYAAKRGVITVAAAGNQGTIGGSPITRHRSVIPVVACDLQGTPLRESNLANSIGRRGLRTPGEAITSLGTGAKPLTFRGTSAAAPFVTGAIALLWSQFPDASTTAVRFAVTQAFAPRRTTVVPPLLDAWGAYHALKDDWTRQQVA